MMIRVESLWRTVLCVGLQLSEFQLQSQYHVRFRTNTFVKGMNPIISPSYELNSTTTVFL